MNLASPIPAQALRPAAGHLANRCDLAIRRVAQMICRLKIQRTTPVVCLLLLITTTFAVTAQDRSGEAGKPRDAKRPFRENVSLPVDTNLPKLFGTIEDLLSEQRWSEAIRILQEIAQSENKSLVLVQSGKQGGVATYLNVATRCNVLLSRIPEVGRTAYRQKTDSQAKRWFENWQRTRDEAELLKIVRQAFLSSYGDEALLALGEVAWDRGDFSAARMWWEQLIPLLERANASSLPTVLRYPDSDADQATILARIVMCAILAQETTRAADELDQFAARYPLAEGRIAGQQGRLVDLLRQTFESSKTWTATHSAAEVRTFGDSAERYRDLNESVDVGALRWVHPLPISFLPQVSDKLPFPAEPLSYHPVVFDQFHEKIVLQNDSNTIRAWSLLTGEPAWHSEGRDPAAIYASTMDERTVVAERNCAGTPHYTMTLDEGRLYARMGSPVTCPSTSELRPTRSSELVCLDLKQEGKLRWKLTADDLFSDDDSWQYEGSPVIVSGRAYCAVCRRHPQLELMVVCLDADDGRLLWQRPIGSFRTTVEDSQNRISHLLLTAGGGRLFLSTNAGAIVALDAQDGRLEWAISYESRNDELLTIPRDIRRKGSLLPAIYHAGLLFAAPSDATSAFCIEADSGHVQWQFSYVQEMPGGVPETLQRSRHETQLHGREWWHMLGVVRGGPQGRLIVSGTSLQAIDIETGHVAWSARTAATGQGSKPVFGRGLICDQQILLPLRESIEVFDPKTGAQLQSIPMKTPDSDQRGGNLALSGGVLLVAQPNRLAAYGEFSQIKQRVERELTARPNDSALSLQHAELAAMEGKLDEAKADFRRLLTVVDPSSETYEPIRRKFSKTLQECGAANLLASKLLEARDDWVEALAVTDSPQSRLDLLFKVAEAETSLGQPDKALDYLQEIVQDEKLASLWRVDQTARHQAVREMTRLIAKFGPEPYRLIESRADAELTALNGNSDADGLKRIIRRYPHATATIRARKELVEFFQNSGDVFEACAALEGLRRESQDEVLVETTLSMIELLTPARATRTINTLWRSLVSRTAPQEVTFFGAKQDLPELVSSQLSRVMDSVSLTSAPIERVWRAELPPDRVVVIPTGQPITDEFAVFLICAPHPKTPNVWSWRCQDWRTGQIRWEESATGPVLKAVWSSFPLLIATEHGWQARTPDRGRIVWQSVTANSVEPVVLQPSEGSVWPGTFHVKQGLELFVPETGQLAAKLKPPGRLHRVVGVGTLSGIANPKASDDGSSNPQVVNHNDHAILVSMQTVEPTRTWTAIAQSPTDQWTFISLSRGGDTWLKPPLSLGNELITTMAEHRLVGYQLDPNSFRTDTPGTEENGSRTIQSRNWVIRDFPYAFGEPVVLDHEGQAFVIADHSQLVSFDPVDGTRKWMASLAEFPLHDPVSQIAFVNEQLFVTSQGRLRVLSLKSGSTLFEKYLGNSSVQWKTVIARMAQADRVTSSAKADKAETALGQSIVAAWPFNLNKGQRPFICLCDANTGTLLQRIHTDSAPTHLIVNQDGHGILATSLSISGLRFGSSEAVDEVR